MEYSLAAGQRKIYILVGHSDGRNAEISNEVVQTTRSATSVFICGIYFDGEAIALGAV